MKKSLKVIFIFMMAAIMVVSVLNNSYAQTSSELNIDEWIGSDSSSDENQSSQSNQGETNNQEVQANNQETQANEEQTNNQTQNTDNNIPEIEEAPVENKQETTTPTTTQETETKTTTAPTTEKKAEEVEEAKLPQTGEKENYLLIIAAVIFVGIAIYAYLKNKKYSI